VALIKKEIMMIWIPGSLRNREMKSLREQTKKVSK
jgi:hypothetical protein